MGGRGQLFRNPVSPAFDRSPIAWVPFASDVSIAVAFFRLPFSPLVFSFYKLSLFSYQFSSLYWPPLGGLARVRFTFLFVLSSIEHGGLNRTS